MSQRSKIFIFSGIIIILATIIISLACISDWTGVTGWAFATMLWSEIVLFGGLIFVEAASKGSDQIITRTTLYIIISSYSVINFIISIAYISLPFLKEASTSLFIIQVIMLAIATTSMTISLMASKSVKQANDHTINAVENTEAMIERLKKLAICPECEPYTSTLKILSDDLRFTDTSKIVAEDGEIFNLITALEVEISCMNDSSHDKIKSILVRLKSLIAQRKISLSAVNKGKI